MKLYNRSELETKSRNELWTILDSLQLSHKRSKADCIEAILSAMPQVVAQVEFESVVYTEETQVDDDTYRFELNKQGYRDAMEGLPEQVDHISYRAGYARAWRDMRVLPEEKASATLEKAEIVEEEDLTTPYTYAEWEAIPKFAGMRYLGTGTWRDSKGNYTNSPAKHLTKRQLNILDGKIPKFVGEPVRVWIRF